nr:hypothetical protein [Bacteroidota bacterium]
MISNYRIFGLNIASAIPLPAPIITIPTPDVAIEYGEVLNSLINLHMVKGLKNFSVQIKPGECLLHVNHIARYYVAEGRRIVVQPALVLKKRTFSFFIGSTIVVPLHQEKVCWYS